MMGPICTKRKASSAPNPPSQEQSAGFERVTHALANVTREGVTCVSGSSGRFPLPGIAFKEDAEEELLLPLRKEDVIKIKARATVVASREHSNGIAPVATAWAVGSDAFEQRNPRWRAFLEKRVSILRTPLGISPSAVVEIAQSKMLLVEVGARICTPGDREAKRDGQFGTLVVVLPGAAAGGDSTVQDTTRMQPDENAEGNKDDDPRTKEEAATSRPGARDYAYDVSYTVFYDHCTFAAEPVASSAALCLVYDLMTSTPSEVPLFAGPAVVQEAVEASLSQYLDVARAPLAKKFKINPDTWRSIHVFAAERHFVYLVESGSFEDLAGDDQKIAQSLEAFCNQSAGQYVLYLAGVLFSRKRCPVHTHEVVEDKVTLQASWIMPGELGATAAAYPPIVLRHVDDVAPRDRLEQVRFHLEPRTGESKFRTHALVVQPASIQLAQIAKQPIGDAVAMLRRLLLESRDKAIQYVCRIVFHRSKWHIDSADMAQFSEFVKILVEINDYQLFFDVLRALRFDSAEKQGTLSAAVLHFGWDTCVDTLVKCILSMATLRSRVNFVASFISLVPEQIVQLLDALTSLHPWTDVKVDSHHVDDYEGRPIASRFKRLVLAAHAVSQEKVEQFIAVTDMDRMVRLAMPALTELVRRNPRVAWLRSTLTHAWELFKPMLPQLRDEVYAAIRIPDHCPVCSELQSFYASTETEITISCTDPAQQRQHIEDVVRSATRNSGARLRIEAAGETALCLTKNPRGPSIHGPDREFLFLDARRQDRAISYAIQQSLEQSN